MLPTVQRIFQSTPSTEKGIHGLQLPQTARQVAIPAQRAATGRTTARFGAISGKGVCRAGDCRERCGAGISHRFGGRYRGLPGGHQDYATGPQRCDRVGT